MAVKFFHNFSARTYPDYSHIAFDSMVVADGCIFDAGFELEKPVEDMPSIDLKGAVILPPFVDSHTHFLQTGIVNSGCQLDDAFDLRDVFDSISEECKKNKIVLGWNLEINELKENRFPTLFELDRISDTNFIWIVSKDLHCSVANSVALQWAKKEYPKLKDIDGLITGEAYNYLCYKINDLLSESYKLNSLKIAENICISNGVATVHALEGTEDNPYETLLVDKFFKSSKLAAYIYNQSSNPKIPLKNKWKQMGGCILVDGSIGSRTAALYDEYIDSNTKGDLYLSSDAILEITKTAYKNNLQLALHAIGDVACDIVASSYKYVYERYGYSEHPNRIEHFILPNDKAIANVRKANAVIGVQPAYDYYWGGKNGLYAERLGEERALNCNPFKTLSDFGISLIGGSDSPVTPINPILGIHSLVNHKNPDEQLDLVQALNIFINEPHKVVGNFENSGCLKKGFKADFVCLNNDPFFIDKRRIKDIKVTSMYLNGELVPTI